MRHAIIVTMMFGLACVPAVGQSAEEWRTLDLAGLAQAAEDMMTREEGETPEFQLLAVYCAERMTTASISDLATMDPSQLWRIVSVCQEDLTARQKSQLAASLRTAFFDDDLANLRSLDADQLRFVCSTFTTLGDAETLTATATEVAMTLVKVTQQECSTDSWTSRGELAGILRDVASREVLFSQVQRSDNGCIALAGLLARAYASTGELEVWRKTLEASATKASGDTKARLFMARAMADAVDGQPYLILRGKAWLDRSLGAARSAECRQMILALLVKGYIEAEHFDDASAILHSVSEQFSDSPDALRAMRAEIAAGREQATRRAEQFKRDEEAQLLRLQRESLNEQLEKAQADGDTARAAEIQESLNRLEASSQ